MAPEIGYQRVCTKEFKEAVENGGMKGVAFRKIDENLKYQSKVFNTLSAADASGGTAAVENALKNMGELMKQGNFKTHGIEYFILLGYRKCQRSDGVCCQKSRVVACP
ncbi:hypothetical protein [Paraburkholderia sp. J67]|uniref:hypothetical protein n=1 Tax=Paraburkholderia sp. J67 TaxID=2805435 RepID=UPI002ABD1AD0|nr:hypothetical protein [Paraburkholderia sp. J67]